MSVIEELRDEHIIGKFHCEHTSFSNIDYDTLTILRALGKEFYKHTSYSLIINSGARCKECNDKEGSSDFSCHFTAPGKLCKAFDNLINNNYEYFVVVKALINLGVERIYLESKKPLFSPRVKWIHWDTGNDMDGKFHPRLGVILNGKEI